MTQALSENVLRAKVYRLTNIFGLLEVCFPSLGQRQDAGFGCGLVFWFCFVFLNKFSVMTIWGGCFFSSSFFLLLTLGLPCLRPLIDFIFFIGKIFVSNFVNWMYEVFYFNRKDI